ncbi:MAG: DUF3160 domain-containing protein [Cytophaga sp.]|uniref:DUF3160 domain-containing protein n=1 Tax=Cytophaga sp. TaxID=29535 RepID=UPI003F7EA056
MQNNNSIVSRLTGILSRTGLICLVLFSLSCSDEKEEQKKAAAEQPYKLNQPLMTFAAYDEGYPITTKDIDPQASYKTPDYLEYYKDYYADKVQPPPFNFDVDLTGKTFQELRLLRAEILARHGFLFMDYVMRSHFNATKWYQPVFWDENFQIKLSEQEKKFIDKVLRAETALYKNNYIQAGGYKKANMENVVNWQQFSDIPAVVKQHLTADGFVINKASHEQLFHVYDQNYYDYTPSFITTDLYLQVLHMHISKEMQALEEQKMYPLLDGLLTALYEASKKDAAAPAVTVRNAGAWNQTYFAVALTLLKGKKYAVPAGMEEAFDFEYTHINDAEKIDRSDFLADSLMDYTQFIPRGNYTRTDSLKQYFKCVKWLNSAVIFLDTDEHLSSAVSIGRYLTALQPAKEQYLQFSKVIGFLAGDENNLSFYHVLKVLEKYKQAKPEELLAPATLSSIRKALYAMDPAKFRPAGANDRTMEFLARKKVVFTAGRYTFDGEILQRLVHVLKPKPLRPIPKALDVFAAMGNKTAEDILLNTYKEGQKWSGYPDTLAVLKDKFRNYNNWNNCVYNKQMEAVLALQQTDPKAPYFMQLPAWQKKNLNTMLASWTELKHDMVLYIQQPSGAEMGDGGEVPPPQKLSYVEPSITCWNTCLEFLNLNADMLGENGMLTAALQQRNNALTDLGTFLLRISEQELKGQKISAQDFERLSFVGGEIERLTLDIIESTEVSTTTVNSPDRYMAVVTDVYTYNDVCLQEGVGKADEIYVVVEINGLLYLTRGAVFSQYEFTGPSADRLTDEAWQEQLFKDGIEQKQAVWMNDIRIAVPEIKTAPNFNLY